MINQDFLQENLKLSSINSIISDGLIISLQFSMEFPDGSLKRLENSLENPQEISEIPGISSSFNLLKSDFLIEIQAFLDNSSILQLGFLTKEGNTHKINNSGILSQEIGYKSVINIEKYPDILLFPIWTRENENNKISLYDILCFDRKKRLFLL